MDRMDVIAPFCLPPLEQWLFRRMEVHQIPLSDIEVRDRLRPATAEYVDGLAGDMDKRGLRSPIEVSECDGEKPYILVSGLHRLMAARQLGWDVIPAFIVSGTDKELRLDELLENLQRNELTRLERCLFVAEYRRLIQERRPETRRGGDRKSGEFHQSAADGTLTSWWDDLAVRSERSRRTIMREASVGEKLDPAAVSKLSGSPVADNLGELEVLSKFDGNKQAQIADVLAATNAPVPTVGAAIRAMEKGGSSEELPGPDDVAYNKLLWHWRSASASVRRRFIVHVLEDKDLP